MSIKSKLKDLTQLKSDTSRGLAINVSKLSRYHVLFSLANTISLIHSTPPIFPQTSDLLCIVNFSAWRVVRGGKTSSQIYSLKLCPLTSTWNLSWSAPRWLIKAVILSLKFSAVFQCSTVLLDSQGNKMGEVMENSYKKDQQPLK